MIRQLASATLTIALAATSSCGADSNNTTQHADSSITRLLDRVTTVAKRPNPAGYDRSCKKGHGCVFGPAWTDSHSGRGGHDGCDTRNNVLAAQLDDETFKPRTHGCVVLTGTLDDPYTGKRIEFRKSNANAVQIDHLVPLAYAWDMGANTWTPERRIDFANDQQRNLLAVAGSANQSKGDGGPGEWLPANKTYRCDYVKKFLDVATYYDLTITAADKAAIRTTARTCS